MSFTWVTTLLVTTTMVGTSHIHSQRWQSRWHRELGETPAITLEWIAIVREILKVFFWEILRQIVRGISADKIYLQEIPQWCLARIIHKLFQEIFNVFPLKFLQRLLQEFLCHSILKRLFQKFCEEILQWFMQEFLQRFFLEFPQRFLLNFYQRFSQVCLQLFLQGFILTLLQEYLQTFL